MAAQAVLITGGTGFLGSAIVKALAEKHPDWPLTVLDLQVPASNADVVTNVSYLQVDITAAEFVNNAFARVKPTVVIHTAGIIPSLSERYHRRLAKLTYTINVNGTRNVLSAAASAGAKAFVYTSSCCAVTDNMSVPYTNINETWPTSKTSTSIYGASKVCSTPRKACLWLTCLRQMPNQSCWPR